MCPSPSYLRAYLISLAIKSFPERSVPCSGPISLQPLVYFSHCSKWEASLKAAPQSPGECHCPCQMSWMEGMWRPLLKRCRPFVAVSVQARKQHSSAPFCLQTLCLHCHAVLPAVGMCGASTGVVSVSLFSLALVLLWW